MFLSGFNAIVVGNTPDSVKEVLRRLAEKKGLTDRMCFARHPFVRGVTEGLEHFHVFES